MMHSAPQHSVHGDAPQLTLAQLKARWLREHQEHKPAEAVATLRQAVQLAPDDLDLQAHLGLMLFENKQTHEALEQFESTLRLAPEHVLSLLRLGQVYVRLQNPTKAYPPLYQAQRLAPNNADAQANFASACHLKGDYPQAIEHYRTAIELQLRAPAAQPATGSTRKESFNKTSTLELVWKTLAQLAAAGIHAFPAFGTLLGIVREGSLLPFDKDLDFGLPLSEMQRACSCLQKNGWKETGNSFGMINPRALHHEELDISLDLFGFIVRGESKLPSTGFWRNDIPKEWNWFSDFSSIEMVKQNTPLGEPAWFLADPQGWLTEVYGNWQVPDKNFDTLVAAKNLNSFSLMAQSYAWMKIFNSLSDGKTEKVKALTQHALRHTPKDPLLLKVRNKFQKKR